MVALAFVGPVLFSVSGLLVAIGLSDVADKFVEQAPAKERQARASRRSPLAKATDDAARATASGTTTTLGRRLPPQSTTTTPRTPEQAASKARDDLASDLLDNSSLLQVGSLMRFVGLLSLVFALIYIPLWCDANRPAHPVLGDARDWPSACPCSWSPSGSSAWCSGSRRSG